MIRIGAMDGCTVGTNRYGTRYGFLVRDFIWYGTWYGFGPEFYLVRYVVLILVRNSQWYGTWYGIRYENPFRYG